MALVDVTRAVALLRAGEPVAIPTETVYGLAAPVTDEAALKRIFTTKARPLFDPLIVHVADPRDVVGLAAEWGPAHATLAATFWPGPLTLVVKKTAAVSDLITSGLDSVGLRCPRHPLAIAIIRETGPLAAPSANRFGRTSPTTAAHVEHEFESRVAVVDGGASDIGVESTVVAIDGHRVDVLRPGGISSEELRRALGNDFVVGRRHSVRSPGHLEAHYRPANQLALVEAGVGDDEIARRAEGQRVQWLELPEAPELAARVLYAEFRRLSLTPGLILVRQTERLSSEPWEAVFDRIQRAAGATWTSRK